MPESYEEKLSCALDQVTDLKSTFNRIGEYEFKSYRESVYWKTEELIGELRRALKEVSK